MTLFAHPHTFIEVHPTIRILNNSFEKIHFDWKIDEMTSSMLLMELDQNGDGKIDNHESTNAYKNYFLVFENYNYYTFIKVDGKAVDFPKPKNFQASIQNHKVCYSFDIDLKTQANKTVLEFGDTDFYVAMTLKEEFVDMKGAKAKTLGVDNDFYYGYRLEIE